VFSTVVVKRLSLVVVLSTEKCHALSMAESAVCCVWSQITSVRLLREKNLVKQIAFIGNLLQGAGLGRYVWCSSVKSMSHQLRRVKECCIEHSRKFTVSVAILERKLIRETRDYTEDKFENRGAGMRGVGGVRKHSSGGFSKTAVKIISPLNSENCKPSSRE